MLAAPMRTTLLSACMFPSCFQYVLGGVADLSLIWCDGRRWPWATRPPASTGLPNMDDHAHTNVLYYQGLLCHASPRELREPGAQQCFPTEQSGYLAKIGFTALRSSWRADNHLQPLAEEEIRLPGGSWLATGPCLQVGQQERSAAQVHQGVVHLPLQVPYQRIRLLKLHIPWLHHLQSEPSPSEQTSAGEES